MDEAATKLPSLRELLDSEPHDLRARGQFILAFKSYVTQQLSRELREHFDNDLAPRLERELGRSLSSRSKEDRAHAKKCLQKDLLFQTWCKLSYESQGMKWQHVDHVMHKHLPELQASADRLMARKPAGSLELDPELKLPANIANHEIHRQPRGFCFEYHDRDISSGALYNLGALIGPSVAAGRGTLRSGRSAGDFVCEVVRARYADLQPARILEIGCGTGRNTPAYKRHFPNAEVVAIDCAPGLLRWAFATAEAHRVPIQFRQMDLARMEFEDASFDLVVSHIVGHETTPKNLAALIRGSWRVLRPGGVMFHADVPIQRGYIGLCEQVQNDFQVRHNGEPFWMGWADADIPQLMESAGIPSECAFSEYLGPPERNSPWYCYGARKGR
jgi:SAM-dependent methyltransferase